MRAKSAIGVEFIARLCGSCDGDRRLPHLEARRTIGPDVGSDGARHPTPRTQRHHAGARRVPETLSLRSNVAADKLSGSGSLCDHKPSEKTPIISTWRIDQAAVGRIGANLRAESQAYPRTAAPSSRASRAQYQPASRPIAKNDPRSPYSVLDDFVASETRFLQARTSVGRYAWIRNALAASSWCQRLARTAVRYKGRKGQRSRTSPPAS